VRRKTLSAVGLAAVVLVAIVAGAAAFAPVGPAAGFRISVTGTDGDADRDAADGVAAYNAARGEWLVAFEADGLATEGENEIFAERVTRKGKLIGSRVRISNNGPDNDAGRDATNPAVAFNSKLKQYLVVWEGDGLATANEDEIFGQRLGATGAPIGGDFRISTTNTDTVATFDATDPDIAYNSKANQYLAVWDADGQGTANEDEIYAQLLGGTGAELGGDFKLSTTGPAADAAFDAVEPSVAYGAKPNQYLAVWDADGLTTDNEFEIFGQRVSAAGGELGGDLRISTTGTDGDGTHDADNPAVAYNSARGQYLAVWEADGLATDNEFEIFGQRLRPTGAELGQDFRISNVLPDGDNLTIAFNPDLAYNSTANEFLATWTNFTADQEIFGQRIGGTGRQLDGDFQVSRTGAVGDPNPEPDFSGVAAGVGDYLSVWEGDAVPTDEEFEIFGRRIAAPRCFGKAATRVGTSKRDVIRGTRKRDVIVGLGGPDTLIGRGGPDLLCGNKGRDKLRGGPGRDRTKQ